MESLFLLLVLLLLGIAVFDLVVGVSNDAVNFLSSAIGANAATFRTIMIVASLGVFIGAASSGGMMEIAKRGVFNPAKFTFQDVIFIYVVVMLTDVLLLDFFNSMKLPTSTTISIVFELLGASLAMSFLHVLALDQPVSQWMDYINTGKALEMIVAIFVSVAIAFAAGWLVQLVVRGFLTFDYRRYARLGGAVFGGVALIVVLNFIVTVGLKTSDLRDTGFVQFILGNKGLVYLISFGLGFAYFFTRAGAREFDPFRSITLIGTFALAMAFASNDLVNFVGVPIAGYEAWGYWRASGLPADEYVMDVYAGPAGATTANPGFLVIAGIIMVGTLWISKKARNVIKTTVDLSRQQDGAERFSGNTFVRSLVRFTIEASEKVIAVIPEPVRHAVDRRFTVHTTPAATSEPPPAFDLVRASTNLTVAALLISLGTMLKLPLSTTYVSFMVLMGTSLADRAWSQDSAVYRVSGVATVIGGWFFTAITALTVSAIFAIIAGTMGFFGVAIVLALVVTGLWIINRSTDNELRLAVSLELPEDWHKLEPNELGPILRTKVAQYAKGYADAADTMIAAAINRDAEAVNRLTLRLDRQIAANAEHRSRLTETIKNYVDKDSIQTSQTLLQLYYEQSEILRHLDGALEYVRLHVLNLHKPFDAEQQQLLTEFAQTIDDFASRLASETSDPDAVRGGIAEIETFARKAMSEQVRGNIEDRYSHNSNEVFLTALFRNLSAGRNIHRMYEASLEIR